MPFGRVQGAYSRSTEIRCLDAGEEVIEAHLERALDARLEYELSTHKRRVRFLCDYLDADEKLRVCDETKDRLEGIVALLGTWPDCKPLTRQLVEACVTNSRHFWMRWIPLTVTKVNPFARSLLDSPYEGMATLRCHFADRCSRVELSP